MRLKDGHYQVALPWRPGAPDNRDQEPAQLAHFKIRFQKNSELNGKYAEVFEVMLIMVIFERCIQGKNNPTVGIFHIIPCCVTKTWETKSGVRLCCKL